jgi:hypothetical protein
MDLETRIKQIKAEQQEISDDVTLLELFTELPLQNLFKNYEMFKLQVCKTEGNSILDKYINCINNKCKMRIDYLENKVNSFEECLEITGLEGDKNDQEINENLQKHIDELNYEKEALEYFNDMYNLNLYNF